MIQLPASLRRHLRRPAFALFSIGLLAAGLAATTATYSLLRTVAGRALPFSEPDRLVVLESTDPSKGGARANLSWLDARDLAAELGDQVELALWTRWGGALSIGEQSRWVEFTRATPALFPVLGVTPPLGRAFLPSEAESGAEPVAILGHTLWLEQFGGSPAAIGGTVLLDAVPHRIVGVAPADFRFPGDSPTDLLVPYVPLPFEANSRRVRYLQGIGRLAAGSSIAALGASVERAAADLAREFPKSNEGWGASVRPAASALRTDPRALELAFAGVLLLFALVAANFAALLSARLVERQRELAVRAALGARARAISAQLFGESTLFVLIAAAAALPLARYLAAFGAHALPKEYLLWVRPQIGGAEVALLALLSALALLGATFAGRATLGVLSAASSLRGASAAHTPLASAGVRRFLLRAQLALCLALLVVAAQLGAANRSLVRTPLGFEPAGVVATTLFLPDATYADDAAVSRFFVELLERARALPEVTSAALASSPPLSDVATGYDLPLLLDGDPSPPGEHAPEASYRIVDGDYFGTLRLPLAAGRGFDERDRADGERVVVVNRRAAKQLGIEAAPLDRVVRMYGPTGPTLRIVGMVEDLRHQGPLAPGDPEFYIPYAQQPHGHQGMALLVRSGGDPEALAASIRRLLRQLDPTIAPAELAPLERLLRGKLAESRLVATLASSSSAFATLLVAIALHALLVFVFAQRQRELGVRSAMGATPRVLAAAVASDVVRALAISALLGIVLAITIGALFVRNVPGANLVDPGAWLISLATLLAIAAFASAPTAQRAMRLSAVEALRAD